MPDHAGTTAQQARAGLDEATSALQVQLDRSAARKHALEAEIEPLPPEQVDKIRDMYLTGPCAAEWRVVAEKIARRELTWREVAEGEAFGDPEVAAALQASFQYAREHPPEPPSPANDTERRQRLADDHDDDPDYFAGTDYLRG